MSILSSVLNSFVTAPLGQIVFGSLLAPDKLLCFRLLWMAEKDQHARRAWMKGGAGDKQIDHRNTLAMKQIITQYGWPGENLVGLMGAQAAWLLVQHADHDREFQKQCCTLLDRSVKNGLAQASHLAYLTDRICAGDGEPQIYGTQLDYPIADPEHVDERRATVGLPPLAEYLAGSNHMLARFQKQ
jgi:hypothetical protein